tara:strand:+ start:772 stop:1155 length:384 start_codon:yes stop_codon:yes gene_type:complete
LLLSLDESCNDFIDIGDTSGLLDLVKGIFNDLNVSQVLVHQLSLFLVGFDDFIQTSLQNNDGVRESGFTGFLTLFGLFGLLFFDLQNVVFILEFHLKLMDLYFEILFFLLMLGLKGDDLVICLFCDF